ncbi:hypothetical protein [Nonomuraea sp. NPDC050643]|uniref:hypothetical protein n=1 Tax=Nonomuraea sp. NPDC050643 TaxID=3155660 RepID=UPI0033C10E32
MTERHERLERLVTNATARLGAGSPWLVVGAVPVRPAPVGFGGARADELRRWVRRQVADWPAPVAIGSEPPETGAGRLIFVPSPRPAGTYYCELHADGSALGALAVGALRDSPSDGRQVWAVGEGAVAWITIAMVRLIAAFAEHTAALGEAVVETTIITPAGAAPTEVWNHAGQVYGPAAGVRRLTQVAPARRTVDLAPCLSSGLTTTARPLVLDLLRRFGLAESRHIDPAGVLQRGHFTGYDALIHAWADAIGVPSEP